HEKCDLMRPLFNAVRNATNALDQKAKWDQFKEEFPTQTKLINYIDNKWFNKTGIIQRWAVYHRMEDQEVTTNNWVESWHSILKGNHLVRERNVRIDRLIYLLQGPVDIDFRLTYYKIKKGLQPIPWRQEDKRKRNRAYQIPIAEAARMITVKDIVEDNLH
ncbi:hypothetical protein BGX21_007345, partial [Mortierella sp. AD011]